MTQLDKIRALFADPLEKYIALTPRERQAGRLASLGLDQREIARVMSITFGMAGYLTHNAAVKCGIAKSKMPARLLERIRHLVRAPE